MSCKKKNNNCGCNKPCACKDQFKSMSYENIDCEGLTQCLIYSYFACTIADTDFEGISFSYPIGANLTYVLSQIDQSIDQTAYNCKLYGVTESVNNYTISLDDLGGLVQVNTFSPGALIIEDDAVLDLPVGFNVKVTRWGTDTLLINAQGGVTVFTSISSPFDNQYDTHEFIKVGPNEWLVI